MKPRVLVCSSTEGKPIASGLQANLRRENEFTIWDQGVFQLTRATLENLIDMLDDFDFAIFVFSPDDEVTIRKSEFITARDNVYFECGLFMGRLGRDRTFFVRPQGMPEFRIPSDLLGIVGSTYDPKRVDANWMAELATPAEEIQRRINELWINRGYSLCRHLQTHLSKPQSPEHWLRRVIQSGYYCGIDGGFWTAYSERLFTSDIYQIAERAQMIATARDTSMAEIPPSDVYVLMHALFERVVKKTQIYKAIATELDLNAAGETCRVAQKGESASDKFLFDTPKKHPDNVWRLFIISGLEPLLKLTPKQKEDLKIQLNRGVKLKVRFDKPREEDNFGVYGDIAVGTLNPESRCNRVDFRQEVVSNRAIDFLALWDHADPLTSDMLA